MVTLQYNKIVLLECDDSIRISIERVLVRRGFSVFSAATGVEGLELISKKHPDLIILNPMLPVLSGFALLDILRAKNMSIPVLAITSELDIIDNIAQQGIAGLLIKPIDEEKLVIHVEAILKLKQVSERMEGSVEQVWEKEDRKIDEDSLKTLHSHSEEILVPAPSEPAPESSPSAKPLILVVDDEPDMMKGLSDFLEFKGFDVVTAPDGAEALKMVQKLMPNAILLDIMLPKMDGYQVCRMLKFDEKYKHIPVIMITARQLMLDQNLAMAAGADGFLRKPFTHEKLLEEMVRVTRFTCERSTHHG